MDYIDPETGDAIALDAVQRINFDKLCELGVHERDAIIVAFLLDTEDPNARRFDWTELFLGSKRVEQVTGYKSYRLTGYDDMRSKPQFRASVHQMWGDGRMLRLWTYGRAHWLASLKS